MGLNLMLHQEWREGKLIEPEIGFEVEKRNCNKSRIEVVKTDGAESKEQLQ